MNVGDPSRGSVAGRAGIWPVALGVGGAIVGLAPWLLGGMRLPLQNLWREPTPPADMPWVLLPFNQYTVASLIGLLGVGAAITGLLARPLVGRLGRSAVGPPQALIGLTLGAIALTYWAPTVLVVNALMAPVLLYVLAPVSAVLVGVAIGWCGLRGKGHAAAAVGSLLLLWVLPAIMHGVSFGLGSRALLTRPTDLVSAVLRAAGRVLLDASLYGVGIAAVVAVVALAGRTTVAGSAAR